MNSARPMVNAMTVDVEDWFQVQAFAGCIPRSAWEHKERRVTMSTEKVLALFERAGVKATFFTLGWVAERHPALVRRIVAQGHELASHGYGHAPVSGMNPESFRQDIRRAKAILQDVSGSFVIGYRAPTFSMSQVATPWAYRVLAEEGYTYSSSIFPGRHAARDETDAIVAPRRLDDLLEIPMTILQTPLRNLPLSGGGWFRITPYPAFRAGLRRVNAVGRRGVFYFHPWELDPGQPKVTEAARLVRFRHGVGIRRMELRLENLLRHFTWGRMDEVFVREIAEFQAPDCAVPRQRAAA